MSSTLESLIRLHRWQVDERRRQVAELEGFAEKLRQEMARLAEERAAEQTAAGASFLARHVYPGYIRRALERQKTLEKSLATAEEYVTRGNDWYAKKDFDQSEALYTKAQDAYTSHLKNLTHLSIEKTKIQALQQALEGLGKQPNLVA